MGEACSVVFGGDGLLKEKMAPPWPFEREVRRTFFTKHMRSSFSVLQRPESANCFASE